LEKGGIMKIWRIGVIAIGIASMFAIDGFHRVDAQTIPNLVVDASGACPSQPDLVRINPALDEGSVGGLVNRMATPSRTGLRLYRAQTLSEPAVQGVTLTFDDDVEVLIGTPLAQNARGPALVRRMREPLCGWLNVSDLERFANPLQLRQIPGFQGEVDRVGETNRLEARVVVKNRIDRQTGHAQRAPLFNDPFTGDEPTDRRGSVGYFEVLSVFAVNRPDGTDCRTFRDDDCFLRVGSSAALAGRNAGGVRTRGWMRGRDVEIWPSALALYYERGKQGLKIHLTEPSARVGTPFAAPDTRESILAYQPDGRFEEPRERNIMRFPVIRGTPYGEPASPQRPGGPGAPVPASSASYGYEIVFNGQACVERSSGGTSDCIPELQIKNEVARLGQVVKAISNIDVLFVVDATESMGPYLRSVVRAVRKHVERATTNREWSFRYSVVVYGDYNRQREGGLDYFALPFSSDLSGLEPLDKVGTYDDENKDKPEAPFAALERAASTAQWRPDAANRLIIWIGDHGNRAAGKYVTPAGELIETKTAQSVIDAIQGADARLRGGSAAGGGGTKTRFVAIQVQGGANAASQQDFRKFRLDADAIGTGLGEKAFTNIPAPNIRNADQEATALVDSIARQINKSVDAVADARQLVQGALGGDTSGVQANITSSSALLAREFLAQLGFPPERLAEMGRRIQVVRNGFVFQSGRGPDYRYWLGLRQPEFVDIAFKARQLCENMSYPDRYGVVEVSILSLVRAVTFTEMRQGESVKAFFSRILSVPTNSLPSMLGEGPPADFVRNFTGWTPTQREQSISGACRKARILQYIGDGQVVEAGDLLWERSRIVLKQGVVPKDFDWRWITADAQSTWYFVPLDVLP
jgi:hypothetical protein